MRTRRVLGEAASLYAAQWRLLTITAVIAFVCLDLIAGLVWPLFADDSVSALFAGLIALGACYYYQGMVAVVADARRRQQPAPGVWRLLTKIPVVKLMAVDVAATLLALGGLALVVVPGLIVLTLTAVVAPVTALEQPSVVAAFRRSVALVRPSFASVFLLVAGVWLVLVAVTVGAMFAGGALTGGSVLGHWAGALIAGAASGPITAAISAEMYFDLTRSSSASAVSAVSRGSEPARARAESGV